MSHLNRLATVVAFLSLALVHRAADTPAAPAAPAAPAPILIVNFTEQVPNVYGYGSWQNNFAVALKAGFRVIGTKGAQGDGGFCQNLDPALDLSSCAYIEIALALQNGNEVPEYNLVFEDADGTVAATRVRVAQIMPGQPVWFRLKTGDFTVSARATDQGKDGKLDWSKIAKWHLQGDWQTKKPAHILFIAIRGRS